MAENPLKHQKLIEKINSNPALKAKFDDIVISFFPMLPEGYRVEMFDITKNKETLLRMQEAVKTLEGLTETEKEDAVDLIRGRYIDFLNDHNKKLESQR